MQIDWIGVRTEPFPTPAQGSDPSRFHSTFHTHQVRMIRPPSSADVEPLLRRILLHFLVVFGGITLLMIMLEAAIAHHKALHAEFCHDIHLEFGVVALASASWDFVVDSADAVDVNPPQLHSVR
jgi:hypothetical protein